jgi:alkanesulfonate monooxygenase SsuD/methylene tetrahydromethanopterin reductase-like flavin-dependent oxidoreductase (luciferase family)
MTIPFTGVPLREHGPLVRRIEDAGYESVWSAEATELDGFTPLVVAAQNSERLRSSAASSTSSLAARRCWRRAPPRWLT